MSYNYIVNHIAPTINGVKNRKRPAKAMDWETITIHNTGNLTSTAKNERSWLDNPHNALSPIGYHLVVDEIDVIECIPVWENAYHAGDGIDGKGNTTSVGIEICESGNFEKSVSNAVYLVASMLHSKNKTTKDVVQHNRWNGSNCPRILRQGNGWQDFINRVEKQLQEFKKEVMVQKPKAEVNFKEEEKVKDSWKFEGIETLASLGLLNTPEDWKKKIDEPLPVWAGMLILSRIAKEFKK
jgi:N-acetylmuramoyl-L-alanine amidase